ncbi:MAG: ester cyclase [Acidimicrobiales bacterium]
MDTALAERRLDVVKAHMASENDHDFVTTMGTFAHPRYELIPTGQVFDGHAEVDAYFAGSRTAFADQRNEPIALHPTPTGVFAEFWLLGTHTGPLLGHEPTGRSFRVRMVAFFEFEPDGTGIVCERVYYDLLSILTQLGLPTG